MIDLIADAVMSKLIADEVVASAPGLAGFILKIALSRLCPWQRSRFSEEWASHLENTPGTFRKIYEAVCMCFAAVNLAKGGRLKISQIVRMAQDKFGPNMARLLSQDDSKDFFGPSATDEKKAELFSLLRCYQDSPEVVSVGEKLFRHIDENWINLDVSADPEAAANRVIIKMVDLFIDHATQQAETNKI